MNRVLLILILLSILPQLKSQQRLKKGEVINFSTSRYDHIERKYAANHSYEKESLARKKIQYTVLEVKDEFYLMEACVEVVGAYHRNKDSRNLNWNTLEWNYPKVESTVKILNSSEDYYRVNFKLYPNGSYSNVSLIGINVGEDSNHDAKVVSLFKLDYVSPMILLPGEFSRNMEFLYGNETLKLKEITDDYLFLQNIKGKVDSDDLMSYRFNKNTGRLLEKQLYTGNTYTTNNYTEQRRSMETIKLVNVNYRPYRCVCDFPEIGKVDTTLRKTNVTIRGKIMNASNELDVSLIWSKLGKGHEIKTKLDGLGYFELRMYLNDVQKVQLKHKETASFMLSPGDDLFITVDMNQFDESIRATGIGSENANYYFDAYLFQEKENLFIESIWLEEDEIKNYTRDTYVSMVETFINKRLEFLKRHKNKLSPEIYLAEYYDPILMGVKRVNEFPFRLASQKKSIPYAQSKQQYVNELEGLIHMDNDMMMFSEHYGWFMENSAYRFIDRKIANVVGRGSFNRPKNTKVYNDYISNYNINHKYYCGITQHVLKYQVVNRALRKAEPSTYSYLYNRFLKEYPTSLRARDLKNKFKLTEMAQVGGKAFDFELCDHEGKEVRLSDFKGKAIYLSFTHARNHLGGKRLKEYNDDLRSTFKGTNTVFIFISMYHTDENVTLLDEIDGIKLYANIEQSEELVKHFYFRVFDRNMIIDGNGNIFNRDAPYLSVLIEEPNVLLEAIEVASVVDNEKTIRNQRILLIALGALLLLGFIVWIIYRRRIKQKIKEAAINTKVRELELTAIRAQMNPHFMYNCLNSIQNLVQKKQNDEAHQYLSKFAELIRSVLKNSEKEEISLATELEIIHNYVALEKLRFDIDFVVDMDELVDAYSVFIPPLILQPLVENAILHGLAPKQGERKLAIKINKEQEDIICVAVTDNGVGRNTEREKPKTSNGKGIKFSQERLDLLADKYGTAYHMQIEDLKDDNGKALGTKVQICFSEE